MVVLQVYKILMQHTAAVQPLSCDEAFLDVTGLGDAEEVARAIRGQILRETGCTASAGIAHNMLLARIATKAGKPNGQFKLSADQVHSPSQRICRHTGLFARTCQEKTYGHFFVRVRISVTFPRHQLPYSQAVSCPNIQSAQ